MTACELARVLAHALPRDFARVSTSFAAAAAIAGPAAAGTLEVNWKHQFTSPTTVRVWADVLVVDAPAQFSGLGGTLFDVLGTDSGASRIIDFGESGPLGRLFQTAGTAPGTLIGDDIMGIDAAQAPAALNPQFVAGTVVSDFFTFEYTFTDLTPRTIEFTSSHQYFRVYAGPSAAFGQNEDVDVVVSGTTIVFDGGTPVIPLPSAAGLAAAGLGLNCAVRRRRSGDDRARPVGTRCMR